MSDVETSTTFECQEPPEQVWRRLEALRAEHAPDAGASVWWLPGFEATAEEVERVDGERLTLRKLDEPCAGTTIAFTFEHCGTGARVHVVQSGFTDGFVEFAGDAFWTHAEHIWADLRVFFVHGGIARRAWRPWVPLGVAAVAGDDGVVVSSVADGTWADRVGLAADDLVCTVHRAPVFTLAEFHLFDRMFRPGDEVSASWLRAGVVHQGTGAV